MSFTSHGRRALRIGLPVVVALLLAAGALAWRAQRGQPRPVFARESELAGAFGVNLDAGELTDADLPALLAALADSGVRWVRFTVAWDQVEPRPGQFDWRLYDRVFAQLQAGPQLQPLVVLNGSPAWARRPGDAANPLAPPQERRDFGAFAAAVARRYRGRAAAYQVWHEPNIAPHWGARPVSPEDYAGLLREAALQIRAADPAARIVLAALAPNTEPGGANLSDVAFLDALYRAGARPWFDAVAGQPYGFTAPPTDPAAPSALNFARAGLLREVMARHGDGAKRIWATAFGWNAPPAGWVGPPSPWGQVDEISQARYAGQAVELAARSPWFGPLFWAAACPPRPADDPWRGFSLCAADGSPRAVWQALTAAASAAPALPPGDHTPAHPALRFSPGWRLAAGAADPSADGDRLAFDFVGSEVALRLQGGAYWAYYRVWVDGRPADALPRDEAGAAYLVLYDPLAEARTVTLASDLPAGRHQVIIEAHGGWGQWALRGVQVRQPAARGLSAWLDWRVMFLAAALLVGIWLWLVKGRIRRLEVAATTAKSACADYQEPAQAGFAAVAAVSNRREPADNQEPDDQEPAQAGFATVAAVSNRREPADDQEPAQAGFATVAAVSNRREPDVFWYALAAALALTCVFSRWLPLDLATLAGLGLVFVVRPDVSLPLIAFAIPLWPQPKRLAGFEFSLYELLIWLAIGATVARGLLPALSRRGPEPARSEIGQSWQPGHGCQLFSSLRPRGLDWPILALLAVGLIASLAAERPGVALREFRTVFLLAVLFYGLVTRVPWPGGRPFAPRPVIYGLLAGMTCVGLVALWQFASGQGRIDVEGVGRVRAFYGSPNNLALVLDRAIPLGLALAAFGAWRGSQAWARGLLLAVTGVLFVACVVTYSKGALLIGLPVGLAVVLLGGAWRGHQRWPLWALAGLALAGGAGLILLTRTPRFADLTNFDAGTGFFRLKLWQSAWNMLWDHPWLGVGPDNFLYAYRTRYVLPSAWQELNLSHPHNLLLDLGTRLGVVGALVGVWALAAVIRRAWRLFRAGDGATWPLALGLLAGLLATVVHGLLDNSLFLIDLMALFALAAAVVGRMGESANRRMSE